MTTVFLSVLEISASASLVVLTLLLLGPFLNKRYAAKWKYWIWIFLALRLVFPVNDLSLITGTFSDMIMRSAEKSDMTFSYVENIPSRRLVFEIPEQMIKPVPMQSETSGAQMTFLDMAAFIWMVGCLVFLSVHLFSYLYYKKRMLNEGVSVEDLGIWSIFLELKDEMRIKRTVPVIVFPAASSPMILGFLHPFLVLPQEQYSQEELFFILKHELVHLKRRDVYMKLLFTIANAVHWFIR